MVEVRILVCLLILNNCKGPRCNVFYPGFQRNFRLEFSTLSTSTTRTEKGLPPRPSFTNPGYNGTVQTVTMGQTTHIDCQLNNLQGFQVSWIRKSGNSMDLLTTERLIFAADARYSVVYFPPDNWRLVIRSAQEKDSASYICQVNTHPPSFILVKLLVIVPSLLTVDDMGEAVTEKYFKPGGTIILRCLVSNYREDFSLPIWTRKGVQIIDDKKGKRIKYEYGKDGSLELRLYLVGAGVEDTGEYTCTIPGVGVNPALLTLYITQGEETAAIQSNTGSSLYPEINLIILTILAYKTIRHFL